MQVHHESQISSFLHNIYEVLRELVSELDVVRASSPLPVPVGVLGRGIMATRAGIDGTLTAGLGDRMSHSCTGDGVNECCFSTTCHIEWGNIRNTRIKRKNGFSKIKNNLIILWYFFLLLHL